MTGAWSGGNRSGNHLADLHAVGEDAEELVAMGLIEGDEPVRGVEGADGRGAGLEDVARQTKLCRPLRDLPLQVVVQGLQGLRPGLPRGLAR